MKADKHNNSDFLDDLPHEMPFNTPQGYFEEFPTKMQQRIASGNQEKISFWNRLLAVPQWSSAVTLVAFAFALAVSAFLFRPAAPTTVTIAATNTEAIAKQSTSGYLVDNFDFDDELLINELNESTTKINKEELENYIIDNYNETQILEEL